MLSINFIYTWVFPLPVTPSINIGRGNGFSHSSRICFTAVSCSSVRGSESSATISPVFNEFRIISSYSMRITPCSCIFFTTADVAPNSFEAKVKSSLFFSRSSLRSLVLARNLVFSRSASSLCPSSSGMSRQIYFFSFAFIFS